jgi:hypothetical protein
VVCAVPSQILTKCDSSTAIFNCSIQIMFGVHIFVRRVLESIEAKQKMTWWKKVVKICDVKPFDSVRM